MSLSTLINGYIVLFLALATSSGALTLWHLQRSERWETLINLAQSSYREYLALESNAYQLFKQYADAFLVGDGDGGALERALRAEIAADILAIRRLIAREIEMAGEAAVEELDALAEIERRIGALIRTLDTVVATEDPPDAEIRRPGLAGLLNREIDEEFAPLIAAALEQERQEVEETLAEAAAFRARMRAAVTLLTGLALLAAASAIWQYRTLARGPSRRLMAGVAAYGRGEFDEPIDVGGARELRELGAVLTRMAEGLRRRDLDQRQETGRLEAAVRARTAELERLLRQIEASEINRRHLMADISHELRTPLTIIQGEADVSLRGPPKSPEAYREALSLIRDAARHTHRIVEDTLLIARQEAGQLRLDATRMDLREVLEDAVRLLPRPVRIQRDLPPAEIVADPTRLRQALLAILYNAVRYGGPAIEARIEAWAEAGEDGFEVVIEDNGPGMTEEEKAQAFERFFRGSGAQSAPEEGTGLGLPIVRAIVRAHGGDVTLDDRPGGGLRVGVRLPRTALAARQGPPAAIASGRGRG